MIIAFLGWLTACDGGKSDSSGGSSSDDSATDDSATDDSGTNKKDDSGTDDSGTDDSGCSKLDWYLDGDGDGFGAGPATSACDAPGKDYTTTSGDCDDADAEVSPDATEICNTTDDDCDKAIDDKDDSVVATTWYEDVDGDGYGDPKGATITSCVGASGYAPDDAKHPPDCNDGDNTVYPGAPELCDDLQSDCNTKAFSGDVGVATWYPASGGVEDWTAEMTGKYGAAAKIEITDDGELVICDGTWYAGIFIQTTSATVTGLHGAEVTILSGGDDIRPLSVVENYASARAQGLTIIEGNACIGAAVSTALVSSCSSSGAGWGDTIDVSLTLADVRIEDNAPTLLALATIVLGSGTILSLEDTTIANNAVEGIWAKETPISCSADPKTDGGVWGNSSGIFEWSPWTTDPFLIQSDGCDFDGSGGSYTPSYDLAVQNSDGDYVTWDFADDAYFICDASLAACAK